MKNVDLSNIIKDLVKYENGHPSVLELEKIKHSLPKPNIQQISSFNGALKISPDSLIAVKTLVASMGAISVLLECYNYFLYNNELNSCKETLKVVIYLVDGYPDIFEKNHIESKNFSCTKCYGNI